MAQYIPSEGELASGLALLEALSDPSRHDHQAALHSLETVVTEGRKDFLLLMLHVFVLGDKYGERISPSTRQLAGVLVKNRCLSVFSMQMGGSEDMIHSIQSLMLQVLIDHMEPIRRMGATLLGGVAKRYPDLYWPSLVPHIIEQIQTQVATGYNPQMGYIPHVMDGCIQAVKVLCEDATVPLSQLRDPSQGIEGLMPVLISVLKAPAAPELENVRLGALQAVDALLELLRPEEEVRRFEAGNAAFNLHVPQILQSLGALAGDCCAEIRRIVCLALVSLADTHISLLQNSLVPVCHFMLAAASDPDPKVAIEAVDFWMILANHDEAVATSLVESHLPVLTVVTVNQLELSAEQLQNDREKEELLASGEQKVITRYRSRATGHGKLRGGGRDDDKDPFEFSLRKQCFRLLESLMRKFPHETIKVVDIVLRKLQNTEQEVVLALERDAKQGVVSPFSQEERVSLQRECGLSGIGVILQQGGDLHLKQHMAMLVPLILTFVSDFLPETRSIACWALGKCGESLSSIVREAEEAQDPSLPHVVGQVVSLFQGLLGCMRDPNPAVQEHSCVAVCTLLENVDPRVLTGGFAYCAPPNVEGAEPSGASLAVLPYLLQRVNEAFTAYGAKNSLALMDVLGLLAESLQGALTEEDPAMVYSAETLALQALPSPRSLVPLYLPFVLEKFGSSADVYIKCMTSGVFDDLDCTFENAAECLSLICPPLIETELAPHVSHIFFIAVQMTHCVLSAFDAAEQEQARDGAAGAGLALLGQLAASANGDEVEGHDLPPRDAAVISIELMSSLFLALGPRVREALYLDTVAGATEGSAPDPALAGKFHLLMAMMVKGLSSNLPSLGETSFSLLGEAAKCVPWVFSEQSPSYPPGGLLPSMMLAFEKALTALEYAESTDERLELLGPLQNALWALGEVATAAHQTNLQGHSALLAALQKQMIRLLNPIENVARVLDRKDMQEEGALARENLAVCLGRLAQACPALVQHILPVILERWCKYGQLLDASCEADSEFAFLWGGLLTVLQESPAALLDGKKVGAVKEFIALCCGGCCVYRAMDGLSEQEYQHIAALYPHPWHAHPSFIVTNPEMRALIGKILVGVQTQAPSSWQYGVEKDQMAALQAFA